MTDLLPTPKYTLMDHAETESWVIRIEEGDYKDVVYKYNTVRAIEPKTDDEFATLEFTYAIIYDAEMGEHLQPTCIDFVKTIGDILHNMIVEPLDKQEGK